MANTNSHETEQSGSIDVEEGTRMWNIYIYIGLNMCKFLQPATRLLLPLPLASLVPGWAWHPPREQPGAVSWWRGPSKWWDFRESKSGSGIYIKGNELQVSWYRIDRLTCVYVIYCMHNIYILHIYRILAEVELSQCHFEQWCSGSSSPIRGDVGEKVGQSWCRAGLQHTCQSNCKSCYFFSHSTTETIAGSSCYSWNSCCNNATCPISSVYRFKYRYIYILINIYLRS